MTLIDDAKHVLLRAWSVRWLLVANVLGVLPDLVSGIDAYVEPKTMVRILLIVNVCAMVSRFIKQENIPKGSGDA